MVLLNEPADSHNMKKTTHENSKKSTYPLTPKSSKKMKVFTLEEVQQKLIGPLGTPQRDQFEYALQMDLIGTAIKETRKERKLTQEELGKRIGVQRAQISRLEKNAGNVSLDTLIRVFQALQARVSLHIQLDPMFS